jgi:hypothetical protein
MNLNEWAKEQLPTRVDEIMSDLKYRNMLNVLADDLGITRYRAAWIMQKAIEEDGYTFG